MIPACVKVPRDSYDSRRNLERDGWYEVGLLETWEGNVGGKSRGAAINNKTVVNLDDYEFSGRLWRDHNIDIAVAVAKTDALLEENDVWVLGDVNPSGFGIFTRTGESLTINLIGVKVKGQGVAEDIIRSAIYFYETSWLRAGTYSDNFSARRVYEKLDMKLVCREVVFHKWLTQ